MQFQDYFTRVLQNYGVDTVFGIVGIPIVELADTMIEHGIKFIACRNEQSASYAASAYGYLTGKPGVLLVVGGPGIIHALAGIYNSMSNKWPLLVLAGSSEAQHRGGFQELDQVSLLKPYVKFSGQLNSSNIDVLTYDALRLVQYTTAGATYLDIPGNLIGSTVKKDSLPPVKNIYVPKSSPDPSAVQEVTDLIRKNPENVLVVVGKGAVHASQEIRQFVDRFQLPFLPTPMGKGVVPDSHPLNVSSARSRALQEAKVVLVLGARLNWILHFASAPKWNPDALFIQVDSDTTTLGHNNFKSQHLSLWGDIGLTVRLITASLGDYHSQGLSPSLQSNIARNAAKLKSQESQQVSSRLNYNVVYAHLRPLINDESTIIVSEGANTMDKARVSFPTDYPLQRLDAGTNATMGVGMGYALAAKVSNPDKTVLVIQGDSAFGFSAMDIETATRSGLALIVIVMNNGGIYHGQNPTSSPSSSPSPLPSTALTEECRYDLVAKGLGAHGYLVQTLNDLRESFVKAQEHAKKGQSTLLNVVLEPGEQKKISFGWQVRL
ncbi:ZYRO0E03454p [Zygosaccharomyces rouxii]|uniref:2-hydroxyacyl-CoA lyase n=1 Tax=Zygosaccharomyces rouxii (strain ATCC 2623 / CBS 732 / NBRC 1130 / NCYC 568 / NRRL Y-229) TaxID=559307 RepID=C5E473_ZYGRC|nr:uncharacterized protein ZYRO0E03454g [Zygosaccharomyces rouxii]KAH9198307.1 thiamine pyrophosphate enzyme, N-terminal TPP binding domain-containing protein [Zygosaccharomyces rouxii]CAR30834.1 ZYRO0E03454p [Zygosaccharomyces rouxii]